MRPMLATVAESVPTGDAWVHEVKWDGMRVLVDVRDGVVTLWSRSERDVTAAFPELAALGEDYDDMLLDGEVVALDDGRPSFHALAERMHVTRPRQAERLAVTRPVTLMVFDLLRLFGADITGQPWSGRRELLERLDLSGRHWQVPAVHDDGPGLLSATAEQGLEGIVSKRRAAPYAAGRRSPDWRKTAHRVTHSVVVGGWRREVGSSDRLGAVLVGLPDG
ncbi:MAG: DNA ligase, partial [Ornithinibacter sp.]